MQIIMFAGKAGSGKDLCAEIFKEKFEEENKKVLIIRFGDLLKFYCKEYFGWDGNKDERGRNLLQYIGTDIVRTKDQNYWVNKVNEFINLFYEYYDVTLIPDVRFSNEIGLISQKNNKDDINIIYVESKQKRANLSDFQASHISENSLSFENCDYLIENNGTIENLREECNSLFDYIYRR